VIAAVLGGSEELGSGNRLLGQARYNRALKTCSPLVANVVWRRRHGQRAMRSSISEDRAAVEQA
jgi:hypothetical protein